MAFAVYCATAIVIYHRAHSPLLAYFDYLAAAFLHGELYLAAPPAGYDLTLYDGRWYVPFPPLPALLMLPFVAKLGVGRFNTAVFSAAIAALSVTLTYALLRALTWRGWSRLGRGGALWLVGLFGLGSTHWILATTGTVWHLSQTCTVAFVLLAVLLAISVDDVNMAALAAGVSLALAMLARPPIAVAWPMLIGILIQRIVDNPPDATGQSQYLKSCSKRSVSSALSAGAGAPAGANISTTESRWRWIARLSVTSALPMAAAVLALLLYNAARFGNPLDFGYLNQNVATSLLDDLHTYGQFSLHYWPRNIWAMLLALPTFNAHGGFPAINPYGLSLLLTTPALAYLVRAVRVRPPQRYLMFGTWLALGLMVAVLLSYYNTGAAQFGYRFSLDFLPEVLILLACGLPSVSWLMRALIVLGVLVNAYGVRWFTRVAGA